MGSIENRGIRSEESRQRLIDAAVESICDIGYARTTIAQVVSRAGMTKGAHVYHFSSKLELMRMTIAQLFEHVNAGLGQVESRPLDSVVAIEQLIQDIADVALGAEGMGLYEVWMATRTDDELRAIFVQYEAANERHRASILERIFGAGITQKPGLWDLLEGAILMVRGLAMKQIVDPEVRSSRVWVYWRHTLATKLFHEYGSRISAARIGGQQ